MKKLAHLISIHCLFLAFLAGTCDKSGFHGDGKEEKNSGQETVKEEDTTAQELITVYHVVEKGETIYVGITNNMERRSAEHLRGRGYRIVPLIGDLSREDARGCVYRCESAQEGLAIS